MNEAKLNSILSSACVDFKLSSLKISDGAEFSATIYCKLHGEENDFDSQCSGFMDHFSRSTNTSWVTYKRMGNLKRDLFRKIFKCQHTSFNKVKGERKYKNRVRSRGCEAAINFKFKKINRDTCKNDLNLKNGLSCIIKIDFKHNHSITVAEAFGFLRCNQETVQTFCSYFNSGMTPSAAKNYHEIKLINDLEDEDVILKTLANAQLNPTSRQVIHLFDNWRKEKYGDRNLESVLECLKKKKESLKESGIDLLICEETMTVVVVTPLMRRVFELKEANEMIFIDSSGSCDQTNTCVTFAFCASKVGALPLGCVLHTSLTEECYSKCFNLLKHSLESDGNKRFSPQVIMTDDSNAERSALQAVFPEARLLLCTFHVCQALWRWLWDKEHGIDKADRQSIMGRFQQVLYDETTAGANNSFTDLISSIESNIQTQKNILSPCGKEKMSGVSLIAVM